MSVLAEQGSDSRSRELKLYHAYSPTCTWLVCIPCSSADGAGGDALGCKLCMDRKLVPPSMVKEVRGNKGLIEGRWQFAGRKSNGTVSFSASMRVVGLISLR